MSAFGVITYLYLSLQNRPIKTANGLMPQKAKIIRFDCNVCNNSLFKRALKLKSTTNFSLENIFLVFVYF